MIRMFTYQEYYRTHAPVPLLFQQTNEHILRSHIGEPALTHSPRLAID